MKNITTRFSIFLVLAICAGVFLQSCDSKFYEDCPKDRIIGQWGVINHSHTFGEYDSLYYVINPIGNINDSVYYNGNYIDSYYHSDPVRVMLRYTTEDSIQFNLERLYATETNPMKIIMIASEDNSDMRHNDDQNLECVMHLRRDEDNGNLYKCGPDSLFKEMLKKDCVINIKATNNSTAAEAQGSQVYEFKLYTCGFEKALNMADSLNRIRIAKPLKTVN